MQRSPLLVAGIPALLTVLSVLPLPASAQGTKGVSVGAELFARCAACHSLDANRVGPMLRGVVGRRIASARGYQYSDALKRVNGRWDARRLERWLQDPQSVAPGTKMAFSLASPSDRSAVIQYLASTSSPPNAKR